MTRNTLIALGFACAFPMAALAQQGVPGLHFIENWDSDGDATVTLEEITARRTDVFYMFDLDENGMLDAAEYDEFDATRAADMQNAGGHGRGMNKADGGMTRAFNDTDGDGQVSEAEFVGKSADWLAMMDRDGSGAITVDDFGRN